MMNDDDGDISSGNAFFVLPVLRTSSHHRLVIVAFPPKKVVMSNTVSHPAYALLLKRLLYMPTAREPLTTMSCIIGLSVLETLNGTS